VNAVADMERLEGMLVKFLNHLLLPKLLLLEGLEKYPFLLVDAYIIQLILLIPMITLLPELQVPAVVM
jgi:hypothetical protein